MASSDQTLEIMIRLGIVGQKDAEAVRDLLKETGTVVSKTAEQTNEFGEASKKAGEHVEEASRHHNVNRMLLGEMSKMLPGLGHALHAAFAGPMGAIVLVAMAIATVREKLKDYNEELDKQSADAFEPHLESLKTLKEAWDTAASHMADYEAKLKTAGDDDNAVATQIRRIKEIQDAQIESHKMIIESAGKVEEANIRAANARLGVPGYVTEEQVAASRAHTQHLLDAETDAGKAKDIAALNLEKTQRELNVPADKTKKDEAQKAFNDTERKFKLEEALRSRLDSEGWERTLTDEEMKARKKDHPGDERVRLEEAESELEKTRRAYRVAQSSPRYATDAATRQVVDQSFGKEISSREQDIAGLTKSIENNKTELARLNSTLEARQQAVAEQKIAAEEAERAFNTDVARLKQLPAEIAQAAAVESARLQGEHSAAANNETVRQIDERTKRLENTNPNEIITSGAAAADDIQRLAREGFSAAKIVNDYQQAIVHQRTPGAFSKDDAAALDRYSRLATDQGAVRTLNDLLAAMGSTQSGMVSIIRDHARGQSSLATEIATLKAEYTLIIHQIQSLNSGARSVQFNNR